ncbi:transmembrane protein 222 isoform X1 [Rana temporaria]|uniref:transmembrane protein 222 isoform X1 n=1 Tax=Rana temporaria TaxID=8407 RepID=UPI001AAC75ED|nr:transmembrane protein 222 isoform X1 [Rana temporaria]XP_040193782.1 transmembrane protein 222 isoform X1 [Rana temporaria]
MAEVVEEKMKPDLERSRFPHCVVWTPIPVLTWLFPFIGHMGICTSSGVIRDFAGPYFVSEDCMAFGKPVKYWQLDPNLVYANGPNPWDTAVHEASEEYKHRMHNLCCDNCHSHVAMALNLMKYNNTNWNMVKLCMLSLVYSKYVRNLIFYLGCVDFLYPLYSQRYVHLKTGKVGVVKKTSGMEGSGCRVSG